MAFWPDSHNPLLNTQTTFQTQCVKTFYLTPILLRKAVVPYHNSITKVPPMQAVLFL